MLESKPFIVAILYDYEGKMTESLILPYNNDNQVLDVIRDIAIQYDLYPLDVWTSNQGIYTILFKVIGFNGVYKVANDTSNTRSLLMQYKEELIDLYDLHPKVEVPSESKPFPIWRGWIIKKLEKIIELLKGGKKYGENKTSNAPRTEAKNGTIG